MRCTFGLGLMFLLATACVGSPARAQQSPNFNRVTTLRREVMVRPMRTGQDVGPGLTESAARGAVPGDPLRPYTGRTPAAPSSARSYSSGSQEPRRPVQPMSVQVRTTPHTFYPGMRTGQGPNRNVAPYGRGTTGRAGFLAPGMMSPAPSPGKIHR
jgi:hypothetical protein